MKKKQQTKQLVNEWFMENGMWLKVEKEYNEERTDWEYAVYTAKDKWGIKVNSTKNKKNYRHCLNNAKKLIRQNLELFK